MGKVKSTRNSTVRSPMLSPATLPSLPDLNEEIFQRAGISKDDRAQLLKRCFDKTVKRLSATHVKVFNHEGMIVYSEPLVDHVTQGKAIEQAQRFIGLSKNEEPKVTIKAVINLPEWGVARSKPVVVGHTKEPPTITPDTIIHVTKQGH